MTWTTDPETRRMVREHTEHEEKQSMTWTREHDRIIAEKCEGLRVLAYNGDLFVESVPGTWRPLYNYSAYLPDAVRAAEAWRKQKEGRYWRLQSEGETDECGTCPQTAACVEPLGIPAGVGWGPAALAHALYQAVTG